MKVLIIGGVAAGTKTAAKLKRADRGLEVIILTKDQEISMWDAACPIMWAARLRIRQS